MRCHAPHIWCEDYQVERLDGITAIHTVHNIQEMKRDGSLMGYILDNQGGEHVVMKAPELGTGGTNRNLDMTFQEGYYLLWQKGKCAWEQLNNRS